MADDYEVGYKKPPKHAQFKPGRSGNPKGRPRGTKNLKTDLLEELAEGIVIREGGEAVTTSKQRALIKTQVARALQGDDRAAAKIFDLYIKVRGLEDEAAEAGAPLTEDEQAVLDNLEARILRRAGVPATTSKTAKKT